MSSIKIGINLRVTETSNQGGRKHMEDTYVVHFEKNEKDEAEFAYFGIFDGHGGSEASRFAKSHLLGEITKYDCFWNDDDDDVLYAIRNGFVDTHKLMWKELDKWPRTLSGFPSTSGTTASIAVIRNGKLYIGHVGDSAIVLGFQDDYKESHAHMLTIDHKPENPEERERIENCGGEVMSKSGVHRVVWNRPKLNHKGPIRRSTITDKIPFLAVARSLGDLWSYDYFHSKFVISPIPDVAVHRLLPKSDKCLILGSDGLWNMLSPHDAVLIVMDMERKFEEKIVNDLHVPIRYWSNPAEHLVSCALMKWQDRMLRADNTSCIVVVFDPLGPSKLVRLRQKREKRLRRLAECHHSSASPIQPMGVTRSLKEEKLVLDEVVDDSMPVNLPGDDRNVFQNFLPTAKPDPAREWLEAKSETLLDEIQDKESTNQNCSTKKPYRLKSLYSFISYQGITTLDDDNKMNESINIAKPNPEDLDLTFKTRTRSSQKPFIKSRNCDRVLIIDNLTTIKEKQKVNIWHEKCEQKNLDSDLINPHLNNMKNILDARCLSSRGKDNCGHLIRASSTGILRRHCTPSRLVEEKVESVMSSRLLAGIRSKPLSPNFKLFQNSKIEDNVNGNGKMKNRAFSLGITGSVKSSKSLRGGKRKHDTTAAEENRCSKRSCRLNFKFNILPTKNDQGEINFDV